ELQLHLPAGKCAGEPGDKQVRRIGVVLGVLSIPVPEHVPGILEDHVLEPATRSEARNAMLPGIADGLKGPGHVLVRAARRDPETLMPAEDRLIEIRSRNPG